MKTYQETLDWMFAKLPMYQRKGASAYRPGLERMQRLDHYLGQPHLAFKSIHIGGTNGKGSTSHILASILQNSGYKVGLYTSPHLLDFRERIKLNGLLIPKEEVINFIEAHQRFFEKEQFSFFELTVAMAFTYFKKMKVDYALIEVGLGGRLDATNIITPILSIITNIGLDHTEFLGTTRPAIAKEKGGIIKKEVPVVIGEKDEATAKVFEQIANGLAAPIYFCNEPNQVWHTDLKGHYQKQNIETSLTALEHLKAPLVTELTIQKGLKNVITTTRFLGRWQKVNESPQIILDVGHNLEGIKWLASQLKQLFYNQLHLVMGFVKGKNIQELLRPLPPDAKYYFSSPKLDRALEVAQLRLELASTSIDLDFYPTVTAAFSEAKNTADPTDLILVCGSTFVVAEVLEFVEDKIR